MYQKKIIIYSTVSNDHFFLCAFLLSTKTFWKDIPKNLNLNLGLDLLIKAYIGPLFTVWRRVGWGSLHARPFLLLPWMHKDTFQISSRWKWKDCFMSRRLWKTQRHCCTCMWFGHWSPQPRCQRTEHSWNLFVIFSVSKLLMIMFTNNNSKTSTYHVY